MSVILIRPRTESAVFFAASASQGCCRAAVANNPPAPVARNRLRLCILFPMPFPPLIALLSRPLASPASRASHRRPGSMSSWTGSTSASRSRLDLILSPRPPERNGFAAGPPPGPGRGEMWAGEDRTRRPRPLACRWVPAPSRRWSILDRIKGQREASSRG